MKTAGFSQLAAGVIVNLTEEVRKERRREQQRNYMLNQSDGIILLFSNFPEGEKYQ